MAGEVPAEATETALQALRLPEDLDRAMHCVVAQGPADDAGRGIEPVLVRVGAGSLIVGCAHSSYGTETNPRLLRGQHRSHARPTTSASGRGP